MINSIEFLYYHYAIKNRYNGILKCLSSMQRKKTYNNSEYDDKEKFLTKRASNLNDIPFCCSP